jgi:hypothetical protein
MPTGNVDVLDLNAQAETMIDRPVVVDVLTSGAKLEGFGDGPSLVCYSPHLGGSPNNLDFVIDRSIADQVEALKLNNRRIAVRLKGVVQDSKSFKRWKLVVVGEVALLTPTGSVAATFTRAATAGPMASREVVKGTGPGSPPENDRPVYDDLARTPEKFIRWTVTLPVRLISFSTPPASAGHGFDPAVAVKQAAFTDRVDTTVSDVELYFDVKLADRVQAELAARGQGLIARVTFQVAAVHPQTRHVIANAFHVALFDESYSRELWSGNGTVVPPAPLVVPVATPTPSAPAATTAPPASPTTEPKSTDWTLVTLVAGVSLIVLILVGFAAWSVGARGRARGPVGRGYSVVDEDDDA